MVIFSETSSTGAPRLSLDLRACPRVCPDAPYITYDRLNLAEKTSVRTQPNIVADGDRTGIMALAPNRLNEIGIIVITAVDNHIRSYENIIAYMDVRTCRY